MNWQALGVGVLALLLATNLTTFHYTSSYYEEEINIEKGKKEAVDGLLKQKEEEWERQRKKDEVNHAKSVSTLNKRIDSMLRDDLYSLTVTDGSCIPNGATSELAIIGESAVTTPTVIRGCILDAQHVKDWQVWAMTRGLPVE